MQLAGMTIWVLLVVTAKMPLEHVVRKRVPEHAVEVMVPVC